MSHLVSTAYYQIYLCSTSIIIDTRNEAPSRGFGGNTSDAESVLDVWKMEETQLFERKAFPRLDTAILKMMLPVLLVTRIVSTQITEIEYREEIA